MVKQLSKAIPTKNLQRQKVQNELQNAVAMPAAKPTKLVPTKAGIRPCLSAIHPKTRPPRIAPPKKIAWAIAERAEFSHTQSCCQTKHNQSSLEKLTCHRLNKRVLNINSYLIYGAPNNFKIIIPTDQIRQW